MKGLETRLFKSRLIRGLGLGNVIEVRLPIFTDQNSSRVSHLKVS